MCKILRTYSVLSTDANGWEKRVSLVSWGGKDPKFDIRYWGENNMPGKGITLEQNHLEIIKDVLQTNRKDWNLFQNRTFFSANCITFENVTCEIIKRYEVLTEYNSMRKEINLVLWDGDLAHREDGPKFDIRCWSNDYLNPYKGTTINHEEAEELIHCLQVINMENL